MTPPTTVVFDLGAVLIDWNPRYLFRSLIDDPDELERFLAEVTTAAWNHEQDRGRSWADAVAELVAVHPEHADLIRAYHERWDEMLGGPIQETVDLLAELRDAGVALYALTNWSAETFPIALERYPFLGWFRGVVVSGEVGAAKPEPAVYQALTERYGVVPGETVFIDDQPGNVEAARALGFRAIRFTGAAALRADLERLELLRPGLGRPPLTDGAPLEGWEPIVEDPAFESLLRPGAVLHRLATGAYWSEGPVWLPDDGSVLWSDIHNNRVLRWHPDDGASVFLESAEFENGHTLDRDGSILACSHGHRRLERLGRDGTLTPLVERWQGKRFNSPNDLVVKRDGTIWFTDPPYGIRSDDEGHQADSEIGDCLLFRFDPSTGDVDAVSDWVDEPNGLAFSPDESILYVSDTSAAFRTDGAGNRHIVAFDVVDGRTLANPRVFYTMEVGFSDGFRVDTEGNVWTSARDGVHVVAPDGHRLGRLPVPEVAANLVFGGPDRDRLFVAASSSLYRLDVAARGVA